MSFLSHELETLTYKWAVVTTEDKHLTQAFDNLTQEIFELTGDQPHQKNSRMSLFSPGLMDPEIPLKHFLGVHLGKRGQLNLRSQFLGFSLENLDANKNKELSLWMDGVDSVVLFKPGTQDKNPLEAKSLIPFFSWNPSAIFESPTPPPTLFWGEGWKNAPGFGQRCLESWIQRNFEHQKRFFSENRPFFASALDWMLSFS